MKMTFILALGCSLVIASNLVSARSLTISLFNKLTVTASGYLYYSDGRKTYYAIKAGEKLSFIRPLSQGKILKLAEIISYACANLVMHPLVGSSDYEIRMNKKYKQPACGVYEDIE